MLRFTKTFFAVLVASSAAWAVDYNPQTRAFPRHDLYPGRCSSASVGRLGRQYPPKYCVYFSPDDMPIHAIGDYMLRARNKIEISTYNMDVMEYVPLLKKKLDDGVKVEFGVDFVRSSTANAVWRAMQPHRNLKKYRIPVLRGRMPQMHNKIIIIDEEILIMGSANFSYSGLVANYENVVVVRDRTVVNKFRDEVKEMREQSLAACRLFSQEPNDRDRGCDTGRETFDSDFKRLAESGEVNHLLKPEALQDGNPLKAICEPIRTKGYVDQFSQPHKLAEGGTYEQCFRDARFAQLAEEMSRIERFHDGKSIRDYVTAGNDAKRYFSEERGYPRVYFSPEDNVQSLLNYELKQTLPRPTGTPAPVAPAPAAAPAPDTAPSIVAENIVANIVPTAEDDSQRVRVPFRIADSFAYVGTNFITNRSFANTLVDMYNRGVDMLVWFDRGRFEDSMFQQALSVLRPLGFSRGDGSHVVAPAPRTMADEAEVGGPEAEPEDQSVLRVFDYQLTGPYGAYHHKFAVVGNTFGVKLINGSANWSSNAVRRNDENLVVSRDEEVSSIFVANYISNLFVYYYAQDYNNVSFQRELRQAIQRLPCVKPLLGIDGASECTLRYARTRDGQPIRWTPGTVFANKAFAVENVPADPNKDNLWAWIPQLNDNRGGFVQFFTHGYAAGRWLATIPLKPGWSFEVKLLKVPKGFNPYAGCGRATLAECIPSDAWEWQGFERQRWVHMPQFGVQTVDRVYQWGNP